MIDFTQHFATRLTRLATPQRGRNISHRRAAAHTGKLGVADCIADDGPRVVRRIVEIGSAGRAPSNGCSIADPDDAGMLDVAGFDAGVPSVIADFGR